MYSHSVTPWLRSLPLLTLLVLLVFANPSLAQNPVDPTLSYVENFCDFTLVTVGTPGYGDPLGDLGIIVHCYDDMGLPIEGISPEAFSIVPLSGNLTFFDVTSLTTQPTDAEGRVFLTQRLQAAGTMVHGSIGINVNIGGMDVLLDNGGSGIPVEIRTPDLNADGVINLFDIALFAESFGCCEDTEECLRCDFDGDGCVSLSDMAIFEYYIGLSIEPKDADSDRSENFYALPDQSVDLFAGCIQRDFDTDSDPATLNSEITVGPFQPFSLKLVAKDFVSLTGVAFEMILAPNIEVLSMSAINPFGLLIENNVGPGRIGASVTTVCETAGPVFICDIFMWSTSGGSYLTDMFEFDGVTFSDCSYPPVEREACVGSPTPCDVSHAEQDIKLFITCPNHDLDTTDTITLVMQDQDGNGVPGIPAGDFFIRMEDLKGSNRGNIFRLTPLSPSTDVNGALPFLFEARESCMWDGCLDILMTFTYQGCELSILKYVRTLNVVRYIDFPTGLLDIIDDNDIAVWQAAKFSADDCLDLISAYRCPIVTNQSINLALAHYLHSCNVTATPPDPEDSIVLLHQNIPNPFNPTTNFTVELPTETERAVLSVYDLQGRLVYKVWEGPMPAGQSRFSWNGRDANYERVASGIYVATLDALGTKSSIRMVLLK